MRSLFVGANACGALIKIMNSIELTKKLIEIESTDPGTYEFEIEKFIKGFLFDLKNEKPDSIDIFEAEVLDGRKNLMAVLKCKNKTAVGDDILSSHVGADTIRPQTVGAKFSEPELVLICHMDTVVVGNDWTERPFDAKEKNGRIYGRGSTDMKSGLAVALKTFEYAVKNIDTRKMKRNFKVIFTVDEEADMRGVEKAIADKWVSEQSFVADLEPTDKMIQVSHKGRFWVKLNVKGKTAHASRPELGIDANACLAEIISYVRNEVKKLPIDGEIGRTTVTFGMMSGGYEPYVVPDRSYVTMDFRIAPPIFNHDIIRIINNAILNVKKVIANDVVVTYEITGDRPFVKKDGDSKFLQIMKDALLLLYDKEKSDDYIPVVTSFSGYTDTAVIASALKNKNTLSYGPGSLTLAHKPDEYVEIKDIERCEKVYRELVNNLLL